MRIFTKRFKFTAIAARVAAAVCLGKATNIALCIFAKATNFYKIIAIIAPDAAANYISP